MSLFAQTKDSATKTETAEVILRDIVMFTGPIKQQDGTFKERTAEMSDCMLVFEHDGKIKQATGYSSRIFQDGKPFVDAEGLKGVITLKESKDPSKYGPNAISFKVSLMGLNKRQNALHMLSHAKTVTLTAEAFD